MLHALQIALSIFDLLSKNIPKCLYIMMHLQELQNEDIKACFLWNWTKLSELMLKTRTQYISVGYENFFMWIK